MNILKSHTSDKLLQLIFYSLKPERKEGTPYMQRRKTSTGKDPSWNQSSGNFRKKTLYKEQNRKLYMKKSLRKMYLQINTCPTENVFNLKLLKLNLPQLSAIKTINDEHKTDIIPFKICKYLISPL